MSIDGIGLTGGVNTKIDSKEKNNKRDDSFDAILNMSMSTKGESDTIDNVEGVYVHEIGRTDTRQYAKRSKELNDRFKDYKQYDSSTKIKKVEDVSDKEVSIKDIEDNSAMLQNFKTQIIDILGINEDQFDNSLNELNLEVSDLLDVNNLKKLLLDINDANETDLLFNEDLDLLINNSITKIEDALSDLKIDLNMENVESGEILTDISDIKSTNSSVEFNNITDETTEDMSDIVVNEDEFNEKKDDLSIKDDKNIDGIVSDDNDSKKEIKITITSESSTSDNSNSKNNDSKNSVDQLVTNLNNAIDNVSDENIVSEVPSFTEGVQEFDIIRQIIDDIRINLSKDTTSMEMQLNPENLGKVHISVIEKNGVMQAQITTETEAAKNAIEANLALLKENFQNQELKVDAVDVMVANYEFFNQNSSNENAENNETNNSSNQTRINISDDISVDNLDDREKLEVKMMQENGNSISYLA